VTDAPRLKEIRESMRLGIPSKNRSDAKPHRSLSGAGITKVAKAVRARLRSGRGHRNEIRIKKVGLIYNETTGTEA